MRLSPNGRSVVFVAGYGMKPPAPLVVVVDPTNHPTGIAPGHSPRWLDGRTVVFGPAADGQLQAAAAPSWTPTALPSLPSGNSVAAAAGRVAVHRTDPRRVLALRESPIYQATDPAYADDGRWKAWLLPDVPHEGVAQLLVAPVDQPQAARVLWTGAPSALRFGGTSLAFEVGGGQIAVCVDVANAQLRPAVLPLPSSWRVFKPVPVWSPARLELLIQYVADDGTNGYIQLASYASLAAGTPNGYAIAVSGGSAFDHDARPIDAGPTIAAIWLTPDGALATATIDLAAARSDLASPLDPPDTPDPPDPPDPIDPPDPPDPPDPEPEPPMSQNWPPLKAIPRDQVVMMFDALDGYLRANPRLGLPSGLIDCSQPTLAGKVDAMVAYGVCECLGHFQEEGPLPGTADAYAARRQRAQDHTVHVIEAERGEQPTPPDAAGPGQLRGPIDVEGRHFRVPD